MAHQLQTSVDPYDFNKRSREIISPKLTRTQEVSHESPLPLESTTLISSQPDFSPQPSNVELRHKFRHQQAWRVTGRIGIFQD